MEAASHESSMDAVPEQATERAPLSPGPSSLPTLISSRSSICSIGVPLKRVLFAPPEQDPATELIAPPRPRPFGLLRQASKSRPFEMLRQASVSRRCGGLLPPLFDPSEEAGFVRYRCRDVERRLRTSVWLVTAGGAFLFLFTADAFSRPTLPRCAAWIFRAALSRRFASA